MCLFLVEDSSTDTHSPDVARHENIFVAINPFIHCFLAGGVRAAVPPDRQGHQQRARQEAAGDRRQGQDSDEILLVMIGLIINNDANAIIRWRCICSRASSWCSTASTGPTTPSSSTGPTCNAHPLMCPPFQYSQLTYRIRKHPLDNYCL